MTRGVCIYCSNSFCLNTEDTVRISPKPLLDRFLNVLERHIGRRVRKLDRDMCTLLEDFHRKSLDNSGQVDCLLISSCIQCDNMMESACDMYHELKCLELRLFGKLITFKRLMKYGDSVSERVTLLKETCDKSDSDQVYGTTIFSKVDLFRKELKRKCSARLCYPQVVLPSLNKNHPDEFNSFVNARKRKRQTSAVINSADKEDSKAPSNLIPMHLKSPMQLLSLIIVILLHFEADIICSILQQWNETNEQSIGAYHFADEWMMDVEGVPGDESDIPEDLEFCCEICGKLFANKLLSEHLMAHTKEVKVESEEDSTLLEEVESSGPHQYDLREQVRDRHTSNVMHEGTSTSTDSDTSDFIVRKQARKRSRKNTINGRKKRRRRQFVKRSKKTRKKRRRIRVISSSESDFSEDDDLLSEISDMSSDGSWKYV